MRADASRALTRDARCSLRRPFCQVVEAVIDSSRYFCLRVADEATGRHAFLGLGFRTRDAASDFKMALNDHERQCQRSAEAARRRDAADAAESGGGAGDAGEAASTALAGLSLKAGDKISVSVPVRMRCEYGVVPMRR
jgi:hypothetical protein